MKQFLKFFFFLAFGLCLFGQAEAKNPEKEQAFELDEIEILVFEHQVQVFATCIPLPSFVLLDLPIPKPVFANAPSKFDAQENAVVLPRSHTQRLICGIHSTSTQPK